MQYFFNNYTKILTIPYIFNEELNNIPIETIEIIFQEDYNKYEYSYFNQIIKETDFKDLVNLTHLTFGFYFYQNIQQNILPPNLTHLTFGFHFNLEIKQNVLPKTLTHLTFGTYFNQKIQQNILPPNLTFLKFICKYNQKFEKDVLPSSLTYLIINWQYNKKIKENVLPQNLIHLRFDSIYNKQIVIPSSLKELGFYCNCNIKNNIPESVEIIFIYFYSDDTLNHTITNIPITVKEIKINIANKKHFIIKKPFGCVIKDMDDNVIDY